MSAGVTSNTSKLWNLLLKPHDIAALVVFRTAFGLVVALSAFRFLYYGWVDALFDRPTFRFFYWGFEWIPQLSARGMRALFVGVLVLGLCVALGLFYRWTAVLLFVAFTYLQLCDVTTYLNHYYLVSLLSLLLAVMPLDRAFSVDALLRPQLASQVVPAWCSYLLRFQVGAVYFFAGLAKLNADWLLHAQPLSIWLSARTELPWIGPFLGLPWVAYAAAWAGFMFDATVAVFLSWRRTRPFAFGAVVLFHSLTSALFPIGMFPVIMVLAACVFFSPSWPRKWFLKLGLGQTPSPGLTALKCKHPVGLVLGLFYVLFQLVLPLRTHLYGGNVSWHEQGMRFSWRVMTREKNGSVLFWVRDTSTGRRWYVPPRKYLSALQEREMSVQPDLILQLAHQIARDEHAKGHPHIAIHVDARVSLNGRPEALFISPDVDLSQQKDGLGNKDWILPAPVGLPPSLRVTQRAELGLVEFARDLPPDNVPRAQ